MEKTRNIFPRTRSVGSTLFGIALFTLTNQFCECKVVPLQTTPQALTATPKPTCDFHDNNYKDGEKWNPYLQPDGYYRCIRCSCKVTETNEGSIPTVDCKGQELCKKNKINKPHPKEGQNNCTHEMRTRKHGTVWAMAANDSNSLDDNQCTECSCIDGFVTCAVRTCPVLSCTNRRNGTQSCCPVCRGDLQRPRDTMGCEIMGRHYGHLETWSPRLPPKYDLCDRCVCKNTSIECRKADCPKLTCNNPERKPGACCDSCPPPVYELFRKPQLLTSKSRVGRKGTDPLPCVHGNKTYPHNSSFHPTIGIFGVNYCVLCFCNDSELFCWPLRCPNYSCPNPVQVPQKCCKVCKEGFNKTIPRALNATTRCSSGKYWRVFIHTSIKDKQGKNETTVRLHFALEDKERDVVEIHTLVANKTVKKVKVTSITKQAFHRVRQNNTYTEIGEIREVQRVKMSLSEKRQCHQNLGCIHTVGRIMYRLRNRVIWCKPGTSGPPDTLRMLENEGT